MFSKQIHSDTSRIFTNPKQSSSPQASPNPVHITVHLKKQNVKAINQNHWCQKMPECNASQEQNPPVWHPGTGAAAEAKGCRRPLHHKHHHHHPLMKPSPRRSLTMLTLRALTSSSLSSKKTKISTYWSIWSSSLTKSP